MNNQYSCLFAALMMIGLAVVFIIEGMPHAYIAAAFVCVNIFGVASKIFEAIDELKKD